MADGRWRVAAPDRRGRRWSNAAAQGQKARAIRAWLRWNRLASAKQAAAGHVRCWIQKTTAQSSAMLATLPGRNELSWRN